MTKLYRWEMLADKIDDMDDDITFLMKMRDYAAENDGYLINGIIASIAVRGMIGFPKSLSFSRELVPSCYIKVGDRAMSYVGKKDDSIEYLLECCLNAMTHGPLWEHCDNCTYIGTYPCRDGQGWADVWLACDYSAEHYWVRVGKDDGEATNDPASLVYCGLSEH